MRAWERQNTRAERDLLARLDAAFANQTAALTEHQLQAVRIWQRMDRSYAFIQQVARGEIDRARTWTGAVAEALRLQQALDEAIGSCRLPLGMTLYRGLRSVRRAFRTDDPATLLGQTVAFDGYSATSALRRVAVDEFTTPSGVLLEVWAPAGTPALWIAGAGHERLRYQAELLLQDNLQICMVGHRKVDGLSVISAEVLAQ